ncbi:class I SAM-dependent methyltransferase [Actinoplanes sp. NPDC051343]|uniref:class I SAM-dependent methyltransferase n=1 Tax=Actinoplanes sp. NPDC051343 TaxID=3363906 RepID=UPI0037BA4639
MNVEDPTAKSRRFWDDVAPRYDRAMRLLERYQFRGGREWVCSRARGDVLEVAVGTGLNLGLYPPGTRLTGVDLSPEMLARARSRSAAINAPIELKEADVEALPFGDGTFDTVVSTLAMCAVPDERAAVLEMRRVLRPGGRLLLLDHIGSNWWPIRAGQRLMEIYTIPHGGEHMTRRPRPVVEQAGLVIEESERLKAGTVERISARKP